MQNYPTQKRRTLRRPHPAYPISFLVSPLVWGGLISLLAPLFFNQPESEAFVETLWRGIGVWFLFLIVMFGVVFPLLVVLLSPLLLLYRYFRPAASEDEISKTFRELFDRESVLGLIDAIQKDLELGEQIDGSLSFLEDLAGQPMTAQEIALPRTSADVYQELFVEHQKVWEQSKTID